MKMAHKDTKILKILTMCLIALPTITAIAEIVVVTTKNTDIVWTWT